MTEVEKDLKVCRLQVAIQTQSCGRDDQIGPERRRRRSEKGVLGVVLGVEPNRGKKENLELEGVKEEGVGEVPSEGN